MRVRFILFSAFIIALAIYSQGQLGMEAHSQISIARPAINGLIDYSNPSFSSSALNEFTIPSLLALAPGDPELPRVYLNTAYVAPTGQTITVNAGGDLQSALYQAAPGDVILLKAGATFTGNFVLPNKSGAGWITVRTSTPDTNLPQGVRVTPASASLMPKIISPNSVPAMQTASGAHHFRFVGIEFGVAPGTYIYDIVALDGNQTSLSQSPHNLIFDRCYIHGNTGDPARRGVLVNSASTAIIDSYISNIHENGFDSQAICGWNGPGPFKIVNNYLEAAGENVMFGGADPSIVNLIPSDIEFRLNHIYKPVSWKIGHPSYAGRRWTIQESFRTQERAAFVNRPQHF